MIFQVSILYSRESKDNWRFFFMFLLKCNLIYNVMFISGVQQSDSIIHILCLFFCIFFSIMVITGYLIQLSVLHSRTLLFIHSVYTNLHQIKPSPNCIPLDNNQSTLYVHDALFDRWVHLCPILDSTYKWYRMVFVFLFLT